MKLLNEFVVKGSPSTRTAQQKGVRVVKGHVMFYEKPEVTFEKDMFKDQIMGYAPEAPYTGPIYLRMMWLFDKKTLRKAEMDTFNVSRPDVDNLAKGCIDCLSDCGFFDDDNIIAKLDLTKGWSRRFPGLFIQIWQLESFDFEKYALDWRNTI